MMEGSKGKDLADEETPYTELYLGMEVESEEAALVLF